jgi:hypothetical protein
MQNFSSSSTKFFNSPHLSSHLYAYNLDTLEFKPLAKSSHTAYMHTTVFFNNRLIVYGGVNMHTSSPNWFGSFTTAQTTTSSSNFISSRLRAYNVEENRWLDEFVLDTTAGVLANGSTAEEVSFQKRQRYAHSAFMHNQSMYVLAGFNGFFLRDLFRVDVERVLLVDSVEQLERNHGGGGFQDDQVSRGSSGSEQREIVNYLPTIFSRLQNHHLSGGSQLLKDNRIVASSTR